MDETLRRLLDVELKAESIVKDADAEREHIIHAAVTDARLAEERFEARISELQTSFMQRSQERAAQTVAELERRFEERRQHLKSVAEKHAPEAIEAAIALLLDTERR